MTTVLGVIGTILVISRAWPQVREVVQRGNTDGVSLQTWAMTLMNNSAWLTLGVMISAPPVIFSNVMSAAGSLAVLIATQRRRGGIRLGRALGLAVLMAILVTLAAILGTTALTVLATALSITMFLPQLVTVLRDGASQGVSVTTWALGAVSSVIWAWYSFAIGKPGLAVCHVVILPVSIIIAVRALQADQMSAVEQPA